MENGFLTKANKFELIETLIKPKIQQEYKLTIESIPNFTRIYDSKARKISKSNPDYTLIEKNMLLLKELMTLFRTIYENKLEEERIKQQNIEKKKLDNSKLNKVIDNTELLSDDLIKNEVISHTNNIQDILYPNNGEKNKQNDDVGDNINEGLVDNQLGMKDTNVMLNDLLKQRDLDINNINLSFNKNNDKVIEEYQSNKIEQPVYDNIIELDEDMTLKIIFNNTKKPDIMYIKKLLLLIDDMDEDILDTPYIKMSIDSSSRYFFNNGINGNYCTYDSNLDFPINIKNKDTLTLELFRPSGDTYTQKNILVYLNY